MTKSKTSKTGFSYLTKHQLTRLSISLYWSIWILKEWGCYGLCFSGSDCILLAVPNFLECDSLLLLSYGQSSLPRFGWYFGFSLLTDIHCLIFNGEKHIWTCFFFSFCVVMSHILYIFERVPCHWTKSFSIRINCHTKLVLCSDRTTFLAANVSLRPRFK